MRGVDVRRSAKLAKKKRSRLRKKPAKKRLLHGYRTGPTAVKKRLLSGRVIRPKPIGENDSVPQLIDETFLAYNAARLREACQLFVTKMLRSKVTVAMGLAGALTPAGLGCSSIIPLIKAGFVDWVVATGANVYHDLHFALNMPLHVGSHLVDDTELRKGGVVRIYDVLLDFNMLTATDETLKNILLQDEFQHEMGTAELHYRLGKYCAEFERKFELKDVSMLAAAHRAGVPVYTSSPGDSAIGMNLAGIELRGSKCRINPSIDVTETASLVLEAKRSGGASAVLLIGGGSPKNFILQTEPYIQDILCIKEVGHDYFVQFTDARPDTGGLSGATPQEAVSWGKVDPAKLPDAVVCYLDATVALPLFTQYALAKHPPRRHKRLYDRRETHVERLVKEYQKSRALFPGDPYALRSLEKPSGR